MHDVAHGWSVQAETSPDTCVRPHASPILPLRGIDHMRAPLDTFGHDSRLRQLQRITNAMKRQKSAI
jgi:hypothetical protein